ncbi:MAG: hypothetical protein WBF17_21315 [Phycisphaerae bacterium]
MLLLRCTHKVLKLFNQRPRQVEVCAAETGLGEWYVNFTSTGRDGFFLFVNAKSLYTLVVDARSVASVDDLVQRMLRRLFLHMAELLVAREGLEKVAKEYGHVLVAKTASRSVLGSMNDLGNHLYWNMGQQMEEAGRLDIRAIEEELNAIPQRPIGWRFALDRFAELCAAL